jgi:hypothetical protein
MAVVNKSDKPIHSLSSALSSLPSLPSLPRPSKMTAVADPVADISAQFSKMLLDDPIMRDLWEGRLMWGDIPGILDDPPHRRAAVDDLLRETPEEAPATPARPSRRTEECPGAPLKARPEPSVPAYTPGIKTVITRNLPRDINVDVLRAVFEKYGPVRDIYIPKNMDRSSPYFGTIKGFALIKFLKSDDSARAYESEYGRLTIGKNRITVEFAKEDR